MSRAQDIIQSEFKERKESKDSTDKKLKHSPSRRAIREFVGYEPQESIIEIQCEIMKF